MLTLLSEEIKTALELPSDGKLLIVTIGNDLRGDDGAGPYIAKQAINNSKMIVFDAGERPENSVDVAELEKPSKVIFIDAANFGGRAGEIRVINHDQIPQTSLSTHIFPVSVVASIIEADTKAKVYFLGIQARSTRLGDEMCEEVKRSCDGILGFLKAAVNN